MGQKQKKDKTEIATRTMGRRTKEEIIEKWDQTESPEIPDRGETSEIPGLPSGVSESNSTSKASQACNSHAH